MTSPPDTKIIELIQASAREVLSGDETGGVSGFQSLEFFPPRSDTVGRLYHRQKPLVVRIIHTDTQQQHFSLYAVLLSAPKQTSFVWYLVLLKLSFRHMKSSTHLPWVVSYEVLMWTWTRRRFRVTAAVFSSCFWRCYPSLGRSKRSDVGQAQHIPRLVQPLMHTCT